MTNTINVVSYCPLCGHTGKYLYKSRDFMFDGTAEYIYHVCTQCQASYPAPMPDTDTIATYYPDNYCIYEDKAILKKYSNTKKAILKYRFQYKHLSVSVLLRVLSPILALFLYRNSLMFTAPGKSLDIGCGNGFLLQKLKDVGWNAEGVEFNKIAANNCLKMGLKVHHGDLKSAHFPDDTFNLITASHVIEHIQDPDMLLKEGARILTPGGQLLIRTPNSNALARKWFGKYWYADDVPRHLIIFSPENLDVLAKKNGLRRVYMRLYTSPKNILNSLDYKINNRGKPSKKKKLRRLIAKLYVFLALLTRRGDEIYVIYEKTISWKGA